MESVLGVPVTEWDDGGGSGSRYDYNIGTQGAAEVTSLADGGVEAVLRRATRNAATRRSPRLARTWMVWVDLPDDFGVTERTTDFRGLVDRIEDQLVELERRGEFEMSRYSDRVQPFCADAGCPIHGLLRLGVASAESLEPRASHGPEIFTSIAHGSVWEDANEIPAAIEQCLAVKTDNWQKLQVAGRPDRHVFFWARPSQWGVWRAVETALETERLPDRDPQVATFGITATWVGVFGSWDRALLWSEDAGWTILRLTPHDEPQSA